MAEIKISKKVVKDGPPEKKKAGSTEVRAKSRKDVKLDEEYASGAVSDYSRQDARIERRSDRKKKRKKKKKLRFENRESRKASRQNQPVESVKTKGGDYPVYDKGSKKAGSFRDAFASARKSGSTTFMWNGLKYSTKQKGEK